MPPSATDPGGPRTGGRRPEGDEASGGEAGVSPDWTSLLSGLYRALLPVIRVSDKAETGTFNLKGDGVKRFDREANAAAIEFLEKRSPPAILLSEESGRQTVGTGPPRHRIVLDPVDGSDNWARGLPLSAVSCAVLPLRAPLAPSEVIAAMVGPLETESPLIAVKGGGARRGGERLEASGARRIEDAVISVEINHFAPTAGLTGLMAEARAVRCYGSCARALGLVAAGATDAHVDVRGRLTAESYLAAARLVVEAGGCVTGPDGAPPPPVRRLTDRVGLVAAASGELCAAIVERLADGRR